MVVLAALSDGRKVVVTAVARLPGVHGELVRGAAGPETTWDGVPSASRCRRPPGHLGRSSQCVSEAAEQRCWNHKILNVLDKLPKREHAQAKAVLCRIPYAATRQQAELLKSRFLAWCSERSHQAAGEALQRDWKRMVTFYQFPKEHWQHLRTTNPVESPFAALRLRTDAAKRFKRVDRAIAVIWKMLMLAEKKFRRLNAPQLILEVYLGGEYVDGVRTRTLVEVVAA